MAMNDSKRRTIVSRLLAAPLPDNRDVIAGRQQRLRKALNAKNLRDAASMEANTTVTSVSDAARLVNLGDADGWRVFARSALEGWWAFRSGVKPSGTDAGFLLSRCLLCGYEAKARHLVRALLSEPRSFYEGKWSALPFTVLAALLVAEVLGEPASIEHFPTAKLNPAYSAILEALAGKGSLQAALLDACDFHIQETFLKAGDTIQAFPDAHAYFPLEALLVERVLQTRGETLPPIDHPIMSMPGAKLPHPFPDAEVPPDLQEFIALAKASGITDVE